MGARELDAEIDVMRYRMKTLEVEAIRVREHDVITTPSGYRPVFAGDWIVLTRRDEKIVLTDWEFNVLFEKAPMDDTPIVSNTSQHGAVPGISPEFLDESQTDGSDRSLPPCDPER